MSVQIQETLAGAPSVYFSDTYGLAVTESAEKRWITLVGSDEAWQMPLVLERVSDGWWEAYSPYGYSGIHVAPTMSLVEVDLAWQQAIEILEGLGVVSLFLRFAPYELYSVEKSRTFRGLELAHASDTIAVTTEDEDDMWSALEGRARTAIRKARKVGMVANVELAHRDEVVEGGAFRTLYEETMGRVDADSNHFYPDSYYERLLEGLGDRLLLASVTSASGELAAAALILVDDSAVHYHLSGSVPEHARNGANNLLVWSLLGWSQANGRQLAHLGGGTSAADSLFRFKSSFGGQAVPFYVGRCVVNEEAYDTLVRERAEELGVDPAVLTQSAYFPAFRAGVAP